MNASTFPKTQELLERSAFRQNLTEFSVWLQAEHYSPVIAHGHLRRLDHVLPRLRRLRAGTARRVGDLRKAFDIGQAPPSRLKDFHSTQRAYSRYLRTRGQLLREDAGDRFVALRDDYDRQLLELRGLSLSARYHHALTIADFLARGLGPRRRLSSATPADVERFIALRSSEVSRHSMQHVVAHLRSFFRYCRDRGDISIALDSIETPRTYRDELPPQALPWQTVQALIESVDLRSKAGWRDHCILHLMAHYGLRPSEVVSLRLDSIDWKAATLHVTQQKTRSDLLLPLAAPTLQVLRVYLDHDRNRQGETHAELFLRVRCPSGPLLRTAIGDIFGKRASEAGLGLEGQHVYRLRHTFAMRLLTRGVGLKAIGDLLGHRSLDSTCAYLRLDLEMLRGVALEVPSRSNQGGHHA
ncbi:MAG: tyrosine-type recombinase/integrase [Betaproteobacteria bacterium]|nr:tyrosine-type recombinase/integrase [Betaproteobacteria bacterium]